MRKQQTPRLRSWSSFYIYTCTMARIRTSGVKLEQIQICRYHKYGRVIACRTGWLDLVRRASELVIEAR